MFDVVEVLDNKHVNTMAFYLTRQVGIWQEMITMFQGTKDTWSKSNEARRAKFYHIIYKSKMKRVLNSKTTQYVHNRIY